jgi:hypothetical protein
MYFWQKQKYSRVRRCFQAAHRAQVATIDICGALTFLHFSLQRLPSLKSSPAWTSRNGTISLPDVTPERTDKR